jgi:hypothetical protein
MSEAAIPLSSLVRPTLSPDWKPAFTSEAREAMWFLDQQELEGAPPMDEKPRWMN